MDDGTGLAQLRPALFQKLLPGEEVTFSQPPGVGNDFDLFWYRVCLEVAAGVGLPYAVLTGDLRQTSYGSQRAGLIQFRRRMEQLQHGVFVFQFCRPVYQRWLADAVLAGALTLPGFAADPRRWWPVKWIPPRWEWIDPLKDRQAEKLAVDAGFKARADVVEAEGYDVEEVDARIKADRAREQALGLDFARRRRRDARRASDAGSTNRAAAARSVTGVSMQSWYSIRAAAGGDGEIRVYDEIGGWGISARQFVDELQALGAVKTLTVRINSPGGSFFDGVAIYNALARHPAHKTVWVDGFAASAASVVAMAGDEIVMPENTMMVIHEPRGAGAGTAADMRVIAEALDRACRSIVSIYAAKTERSAADIEALLAAETWMSAQEAFDLGFADRVEPAVAIAARFDLASSSAKHPPAAVAALLKEAACAVAAPAARRSRRRARGRRGRGGGGTREHAAMPAEPTTEAALRRPRPCRSTGRGRRPKRRRSLPRRDRPRSATRAR